jgi:hypothetical protein
VTCGDPKPASVLPPDGGEPRFGVTTLTSGPACGPAKLLIDREESPHSRAVVLGGPAGAGAARRILKRRDAPFRLSEFSAAQILGCGHRLDVRGHRQSRWCTHRAAPSHPPFVENGRGRHHDNVVITLVPRGRQSYLRGPQTWRTPTVVCPSLRGDGL